MEYVPGPNKGISKEEAQIIGTELEKLSNNKPGLTAADIVQAASKPKSPLHSHFEWDDVRAAQLWRESEARSLVRTISVIVESTSSGSVSVRAFHAIRANDSDSDENHLDDDSPAKIYVSTARVQTNENYAKQVIANAKRELDGWQRRYSAYCETLPAFHKQFQPVVDAIENLEDRMPWHPPKSGDVRP